MLSARNQIKGLVKSVRVGNMTAEVVISAGDFEIASIISKVSVERLDLKIGDEATAIIKSTDVIIEK
jgi:molybdopterin-binding protein